MNFSAKWTDFSKLDSQRLLAWAQGRLPQWVTLALVVLLGWQLARLIWLLVAMPASGTAIDPPAMPAQAAISGRDAGGADVQLIANAHLFGEASAGEAPPPPEEAVENLAETRLSLTLKGTIAATDAAGSIAIIADSRNEEHIYGVKDTVTDGTTLHAVYADRVVLNRGGNLEVLKLPRDFPEGSNVNARRNATTTSRAAADDDSRSIQNVVAQNVTKLADVIRPTPYFVGGQQQGYRVYPGRNRRQFAALGLRPGDLIKDIDGASLTDPQQAMQIFQSLGTAEQVSVTVERNGQPQTLVLNTDQLDLDDEK